MMRITQREPCLRIMREPTMVASIVTQRDSGLKRGNPGVFPAFTRLKNDLNARSSRRSIPRCGPTATPPMPCGSSRRSAVSALYWS